MTGHLQVRGLGVSYGIGATAVRAVTELDLDVLRGRTLGLVGESGCGKSTVALALCGMQDPSASVSGSVLVRGEQVVGAPEPVVRRLRGAAVGLVFQNPLAALHPCRSVGRQIADAYRVHHQVSRRAAMRRAVDLLARVGIHDPRRRQDEYPHQFSGGMRQRAVIAMAIVNEPDFLIADEPTTALDVTVQAQILRLLFQLRDETGMGMLLISHDLGVVAEIADDICVMYAGRVIETGPTRTVLHDPRMPYTRALMDGIPRLDAVTSLPLVAIPGAPPRLDEVNPGCAFLPRCRMAPLVHDGACAVRRPALRRVTDAHSVACHLDRLPARTRPAEGPADDPPVPAARSTRLLEVSHLAKAYAVHGAGLAGFGSRRVPAVDDVSFVINAGESFGLVGESGSGKSTTGRLVVGLERPDSGSVRLDGRDVTAGPRAERRRLRREVQMVFQDPSSSLNGRHRIETIIATPLEVHRVVPRSKVSGRVGELMELVGLDPDDRHRYPHQLSGGQRQRVGIARALALEPRLVVADEPVSSLDVSIRAQILNLLNDLQAELGIAFLFIAHDLAMVRHFCSRVAVLQDGRIVEAGDRESVFTRPAHPHTQALLAAVPRLAESSSTAAGAAVVRSG